MHRVLQVLLHELPFLGSVPCQNASVFGKSESPTSKLAPLHQPLKLHDYPQPLVPH